MNLFHFDHVLFYGRDYDEVLQMMALKEDELAGQKILDCPSGPDAFVAEACRRGFDVTGCDPLYAKSAEEIVAAGSADIDVGEKACMENTELVNQLDLKAFHNSKRAALDKFGSDFTEGKASGRYVYAALPELPFKDNSFDLVVSSNFLFSYSLNRLGGLSTDDTFDLEFHLAAIRELMRVSRSELRLYPLMTQEGNNRIHPYAAQAMGELAREGVALKLLTSTYDQSVLTGTQILVIDCKPH